MILPRLESCCKGQSVNLKWDHDKLPELASGCGRGKMLISNLYTSGDGPRCGYA